MKTQKRTLYVDYAAAICNDSKLQDLKLLLTFIGLYFCHESVSFAKIMTTNWWSGLSNYRESNTCASLGAASLNSRSRALSMGCCLVLQLSAAFECSRSSSTSYSLSLGCCLNRQSKIYRGIAWLCMAASKSSYNILVLSHSLSNRAWQLVSWSMQFTFDQACSCPQYNLLSTHLRLLSNYLEIIL